MTIKFDVNAFTKMLDVFEKSLTRTPRVKQLDNYSGDERLIPSTPITIQGAFFRQEDVWVQQYGALVQGADAVLLVKPNVVIAREDLITYKGENYRIDKVTRRRLGDTQFYQVARLFKE